MKKSTHFSCWIILLPVFYVCSGYSQSQKIMAAVDSFRQRMPMEKMYLHIDRPYYSIGDTICFKSYLFNSDIEASGISKLLYVELCTDSGKVVLRQLLPVEGGLSWGNISLDDKLFTAGTYTLRAYTNWMQNFGTNAFFTKQLQIYHPMQQEWLVKYHNEINNDTVHARLQLNTVNGALLSYHPITITLLNGKKTFYTGNANTSANGTLHTDFLLPDKPGALSMAMKDGQQSSQNPQNLNFPIPMQRPENTDLQFLPEGGSLVAGIPTRIAFKAIGEDGKAVEVSGKIYSSHQQEVATFSSTHAGMGSFELLPEAGEKYTAKLMAPKAAIKTWDLPEMKQQGTALRIDNVWSTDSLTITIQTNRVQADPEYYITGQSRNVVCYAARLKLTGTHKILRIPKTAFPTGIARFTLLSAGMQPLNERMVFINHYDTLAISIITHQLHYTTRDSIALAITVTNGQGQPVQGSFSLSVTDDGQVKSNNTENILTGILLTSNLKGEIDHPAYYFSANDSTVQKDLDNLLLTQGWTGYDWKDVWNSKPALPDYMAEKEYLVTGKVSNLFNKGVSKSMVTLLCKRPFFVTDTLTNTAGEFIFRNINPVDTGLFFIQAKNKSGNSMNVGITVNEFKPPVPVAIAHPSMPWYINTDTTQITYVKAAVAANRERLRIPEGSNMLQEVIVKGKKIIRGSFNLNGPGEADQVIDKEELEKAGTMTLGDLIAQRILGFKIGEFPLYVGMPPERLKASDPRRKQCYLIGDKQMRLVIDGYDVDYTYQENDSNSRIERFLYIQSYLNYYTAADIKGIEVMVSKKYNNSYNSKVLTWEDQKNLLSSNSDIAYLEITTRSGHGPFMKATPGTYLYKPLPFSLPKQFYSPRYLSKQKDATTDTRSTIYWHPNVVTDSKGKAIVSFYSSDRIGTYTIKIEGSNMSGDIGTATRQIKITP